MPRRRVARARVSRLLALALAVALLAAAPAAARAKRGVRIPDALDDVMDDEEDADFRDWGAAGRRSTRGAEPGPSDESPSPEDGLPTKPDGSPDVDAILASQNRGPQLTFARLRPDPNRVKADVDALGVKWASLLRSGGMSESVYAIDVDTILVNVKDGSNMAEVREFLWMQDEVESHEWKNQIWPKGSDAPVRQDPAARAKEAKPEPQKKKRKKRKRGKKKGKSEGEGEPAKEEL